jgi:hypothetical protein
MANLRFLPLSVLAGACMLSNVSFAQQAAPNVRIVSPIDENQLVTLTGNVHPAASAKNDRGPVSASLPMADLVLVLSRSPEQQAAFDQYVQGEYDSGSPDYHQWLTPGAIGERFGPSLSDVATVTGWLTGHGFAVTQVSNDRLTITFSGTAGQVESTFHTAIHNLSVSGVPHIANMTDPQIPAALAPVVVGVKQLHNFFPHPLHHAGSVVRFNQAAGGWQRVASLGGGAAAPHPLASLPSKRPRSEFGISGTSDGNSYLEEDVAPYDFATIYNVLPLWKASTPINGTGETIAIAGTSDITASDVSQFRSAFGLPAGLTPIVDAGVNGTDPGVCTGDVNICNSSDLLENSLDVEWSGAVAPGAQIVLATSGYNSQTAPTNDPIFESAQFVVENHGSGSSTASIKDVAGASILSVSYGICELGEGTSGNVAYYDLWQSAAAEGLAVFVATGDAGAAGCDDGGDSIGNPYSAQFGLTVSGLASTPYNVAVGGTDFSWCQPYYIDSGSSEGNVTGCAETLSTAGPYWSTSSSGNNTTAGGYESAVGYVPETPWNDTCMNPIWAKFIETLAPLTGLGSTPANAEASCDYVQNEWFNINEEQVQDSGQQYVLAGFVDTIGGGGGASNCVVNDIATDPDNPTCTASTSTGAANGSIPLTNDGWQKPSWQAGVTGIPNDGVRDLPDLSLFAGDGALDSASLVCVESLQGAACTASATTTTALEVGGTSVATPEMAGVMALINQKAGASQGLPNAQLYKLAGAQTYSSCSAESVKNSSASCYFNDVDQGTITQPCDFNGEATVGGAIFDPNSGEWDTNGPVYAGSASPNCAALNSGDTVGTLVSSGTTPGYNAGTGFDLATGLGSLNVANVVNAWTSDAGTNTATMTITPTPAATSGTINLPSGANLVLAVTVTGSHGTPTGEITAAGGGYSATGTLASGAVTITIPAGSLAPGTDSLTVTYSGDSNYATTSQTLTVDVAATTPTVTVTVTSPNPDNVVNAVNVTVTVAGPLNSPTPTGMATISGGSYSSTPATLSSDGTASFTIPAGQLPAGTDTLTASYGGTSPYTSGTGTTTIVMVNTSAVKPTIVVTPTPASIDTSQSLTVTVTVSGSSGTPTGNISLTAGSSTVIGTGTLVAGVATITVPGNTLSAGSDTLTAAYGGDNVYGSLTGTGTVTVTESTYALTASAATPTSVTPGGTATSTISGTTTNPNTFYTGTVTLNSCTMTSSSVTNPVSPPTCTVSGTITYTSGTASGTGTATVSTTSNLALLEPGPASKGWLGAGGGAVLAFLVFLGIPARRRTWRAMLGLVVLLAALGSLSACGGGSISTTQNTATSAGTYNFSVSGTASPTVSPAPAAATFTVTVN